MMRLLAQMPGYGIGDGNSEEIPCLTDSLMKALTIISKIYRVERTKSQKAPKHRKMPGLKRILSATAKEKGCVWQPLNP
jgi:hypothetical protein